MKVFNKITITLFFFFVSLLTGNAQIARSVTKAAAKKATKSIIKSAVKAETKNIAKQSAKTVIKSEVKNSVKKAAVEAAEASVKGVAKRTTIEAAETSAKNITKRTASEAAEIAAKRAAKKTAVETAETAARKISSRTAITAAEDIAKESAEKMSKKVVGETSETVVKREARSTATSFSKFAEERAAKLAEKRTVKVAEKTTLKEARTVISKNLNSKAAKVWERVAGKSSKKSTTLAQDLSSNPEFKTFINKNPQLLETYDNLIASKYRNDVTAIRYFGNNVDKYNMVYKRVPSNRAWLNGKQLVLSDKSGVTYICEKSNMKPLGTIEGSAKSGYIINIDKTAKTELLDVYPLGNCKYVKGNMCWITDKYGRVEKSIVTIDRNVSAAGRDANFIQRIKDAKTDYDAFGKQMKLTGTYDDVSGHIIPDSWGGESTSINIIPQNKKVNGAGSPWYNSERDGLKMAEKGHEVTRTIILEYSGTSQRPDRIIVSQTVDGDFQKVGGMIMDAIKFNNE